MSNLQQKITEIVAEQLGEPVDAIKPDARFDDDLGADSLDQVNILAAIEEQFEVEIPDDEGEKLLSVSDYERWLEAHARTHLDTVILRDFQRSITGPV